MWPNVQRVTGSDDEALPSAASQLVNISSRVGNIGTSSFSTVTFLGWRLDGVEHWIGAAP
jgi:hypothetical protein